MYNINYYNNKRVWSSEISIIIIGSTLYTYHFQTLKTRKYKSNTSVACLTVLYHTSFNCRSHRFIKPKEPEGFIASVVTMETKCGSPQSPYVIEGEVGQRINITLMDFAYYDRLTGSGVGISNGASPCEAYATFKESDGRPSTTLCGGRVRESVAYTSTTNRLQVTIIDRTSPRYFLLKYHG